MNVDFDILGLGRFLMKILKKTPDCQARYDERIEYWVLNDPQKI